MNNNGTLSYPVFKANQVLTDGHLNAAVSYLEAQTLLTRATLIGTGIICGFEPAIDGDDLTISPGCGVTTEGYLVVIPETSTLTHYRLAKLSKKDPPCERDLPGLGKDVLIDGKTFLDERPNLLGLDSRAVNEPRLGIETSPPGLLKRLVRGALAQPNLERLPRFGEAQRLWESQPDRLCRVQVFCPLTIQAAVGA